MVGDYIIKDMMAKNGGELTELHLSAMGAECIITDLEKGERSLLRVKPDYDPNDFHRIHTSTVLDYTVSDNGNDVVIETLNTIYHLVRCNFDDASFTGINAYTYDVARETVKKHLNDKDDSYFAKYGMTKNEAIESDDLISRCAALHHRLVKDAGIDYAWACDFACDNALAEEKFTGGIIWK